MTLHSLLSNRAPRPFSRYCNVLQNILPCVCPKPKPRLSHIFLLTCEVFIYRHANYVVSFVLDEVLACLPPFGCESVINGALAAVWIRYHAQITILQSVYLNFGFRLPSRFMGRFRLFRLPQRRIFVRVQAINPDNAELFCLKLKCSAWGL